MGTRVTLGTRRIYSVMIGCIMRNYYFTSVSVCESGTDSVLCSWFRVLFFRLEICLSVSGFGFSILLVCFVLGSWISISWFWFFLLYYRHQGKLSVFYMVWFWFVFFDSGFYLVLSFWNPCFCSEDRWPVFYFMTTHSIKIYGPNRRLHGREHLSCIMCNG